ncbi:MAG: hypothetical protein Q9167_006050 [Letrouitia subvulpina]
MPPKASKSKSHSKAQEEKREESLQAVVSRTTICLVNIASYQHAQVLADSYETRFTPFTLERPRCLLPLANTPLIEYTLEFLAHTGIQEVFIYCGLHTGQVEEYINSSKWKSSSSSFRSLTLLKSDATSVGDALRDLDHRDLITGDFVLVSGDVISNISIEASLAKHRTRREKDKNAIMTILLREAGIEHRTKSAGRRPVFVIDPSKKRCLHYEEMNSSTGSGTNIEIDPDLLSSHGELEIREDLIDCYIDICTPDVLNLWSDNFDYQSVRTSFLYGVLKDYELNGKTIHTHIISDQYAARVKSLRAYDAISKDVIGRWAYPLCPDSNLMRGQSYRYGKGEIYTEDGVVLGRNCSIQNRSVLGAGTSIGNDSIVRETVLGRQCRIGRNTVLEGAYIWDNAVVGDGSVIKRAIIGKGAIVGNNCIVEQGALISYDVKLSDNIVITGTRKLTRIKAGGDVSPQTELAVVGEGGEGYDHVPDSDSDSNRSSASASLVYRKPDASLSNLSISTLGSTASEYEAMQSISRKDSLVSETSNEAEPNKDFHVEATSNILDSLQKDELPDNIFLELNAFRMTVDVSQHEIRRAVVTAFLKRVANLEASGLGARESVQKVFGKYKAVLDRTIFDKEAQMKPDQIDLLILVQEQLVGHAKGDNLMLFVAKELYDIEVVEKDGILQWWDDKRSKDGEMTKLRGLTEKFVSYLEEEEEDDDDDDEDDEEDDDSESG